MLTTLIAITALSCTALVAGVSALRRRFHHQNATNSGSLRQPRQAAHEIYQAFAAYMDQHGDALNPDDLTRHLEGDIARCLSEVKAAAERASKDAAQELTSLRGMARRLMWGVKDVWGSKASQRGVEEVVARHCQPVIAAFTRAKADIALSMEERMRTVAYERFQHLKKFMADAGISARSLKRYQRDMVWRSEVPQLIREQLPHAGGKAWRQLADCGAGGALAGVGAYAGLILVDTALPTFGTATAVGLSVGAIMVIANGAKDQRAMTTAIRTELLQEMEQHRQRFNREAMTWSFAMAEGWHNHLHSLKDKWQTLYAA